MVVLNDRQTMQLREALLKAFPSRSALEEAVYYQLGGKLVTITPEGSLTDMTFGLINWAESHGKTAELVNAALTVNPGVWDPGPLLRYPLSRCVVKLQFRCRCGLCGPLIAHLMGVGTRGSVSPCSRPRHGAPYLSQIWRVVGGGGFLVRPPAPLRERGGGG